MGNSAITAGQLGASGTVTTVQFTAANGFTGTVSTATTTPTLSLQRTFDSMVRLQAGNGFGPTNTKIRRYTTVVTNMGSDITYADSATLGATFTINTAGVYAMRMYDCNSTTPETAGFSLNSNQLTTSLPSITGSNILAESTSGAATFILQSSTTLYLTVGDVVRVHTGVNGLNATTAGLSGVTIQRVG